MTGPPNIASLELEEEKNHRRKYVTRNQLAHWRLFYLMPIVKYLKQTIMFIV